MTDAIVPTGERIEPAPEQAEAIGDRGRDLFLQAGAGTGKTAVLVQRFCEVVAAEEGPDADTGVGNVLAFTFTDRAAGEMKRRVRDELRSRAAAERDPGRARRLAELAREAESAWVSTIHSFCQRLLTAHPLAAGLDPRFAVLDAGAAARLAAESFDAAYERFAAGGGEAIELAAAFDMWRLRDLVVAAHDELRSRGLAPVLPERGEPDADGAVAELHAAAEAALEATRDATRGKVEHYRDCMRRALELGPEATEEMVAECCYSTTAQPFKVEEVTRYHAACRRMTRLALELQWAHRYEHLRELVQVHAAEYEARKTARGALDFEDLQLRARDLLRERPQLRRRLQRRFHHVMVDEFQDTNELQLDLVELLHTEDGAARNRLFTVGDELQSIYSFRHADVDVFRRVRDLAAAAPANEAGVRELTGSFRSRPEVLAAVNAVGRALLPGFQELAAGRAPDGPARGPGPAVEMLVTERDGWTEEGVLPGISPDEQAPAWRVAEARFLAERLRELADGGYPRGDMVMLLRAFTHVEAYERALADQGLEPLVVGGRGYWSLQQVADLRHLLAVVANPLDEMALFSTLASPACAASPDALWLIRRASAGRRAWSVVRRFFGTETPDREEPSEEELSWRAEAEGWLAHMPERDAAAVRKTTHTLLALREEAPRLGLEELIDTVVTRLGYDLAILARDDGRRRMANIRKLMRLARDFEASEGRDLRAFVDHIDAERESAGREGEAALESEGHDGVRIMTVHAAKGLEFPLVAVADLGRDLWGGRPPDLRLGHGGEEGLRVGLRLVRLGAKGVPILDYESLNDEANERADEEERRILHVALTRAEERLVLSGACRRSKLGEEPAVLTALIRRVLPALGIGADLLATAEERGEPVSVTVPPAAAREGLELETGPVEVAVRLRVPRAEEGQQTLPLSLGPAPRDRSELERPLPDPVLDPLPGAAAGGEITRVSYSALALYGRCPYRFYAERVLRLPPALPAAATPREPDPGAPEEASADELSRLGTRFGVGVVVHELLERSARLGWEPPGHELAGRLLSREGIDPAEAGRALALVEGFLGSELRASLAGARRILPEVPFAFRLGGLVVRGEIDLLAELDGETCVVDYKSDRLAGADPASLMDRYDVQRRIYALAALRRHGVPVRVAYVFLERPDEPVVERYEVEDADGLTADLARLAGGIEAGDFPVTESPHRDLCLDCPARRRLCSHPPEKTLATLAP